jgi:hypothetical protein
MLGVLCVSCNRPTVRYETEALAGEEGVSFRIDYGYTDDDEVVFVVMQKVRDKRVMDYHIEVVGQRASGWFVIPGKGRIQVVDMRGGYEADDSGVREHVIRFSAHELKAFLSQSKAPKELSFEAMERFAGR